MDTEIAWIILKHLLHHVIHLESVKHWFSLINAMLKIYLGWGEMGRGGVQAGTDTDPISHYTAKGYEG